MTLEERGRERGEQKNKGETRKHATDVDGFAKSTAGCNIAQLEIGGEGNKKGESNSSSQESTPA